MQRQMMLGTLLMKQQSSRTIKEYAQLLKVSERTISSDLKEIEGDMLTGGYAIKKQPGIGITVQTVSQKKKEKTKSDSIHSGKEARRKAIMNLLLFQGKVVTFDSLSELFLVSKSSITNDLHFIKEKLLAQNIQLVSDLEGTKIVGTEQGVQQAHLIFNTLLFEEDSPFLNFELEDEQKTRLLSEYYGLEIVSVCSRVLYEYIKKNTTVIGEHYIFNLLNNLIILVYRMSKGKHLLNEMEADSELPEQSFFEKTAQEMLHKITTRLDLKYELGDITFFSKQLISNKFQVLPTATDYSQIIKRMIQRVGQSLNLCFSEDYRLAEQLALHIPPMIYRLREQLHISNPFLRQIKEEFGLVYNVIWLTMSGFEEELSVFFNKEEIGFLTIYFQSAIDRGDLSKKILIICPTGIATSELLVNRMKKILPPFDSLAVASAKEVKDLNLEEIDLIVSTVRIKIPNKKVVIVSPLLTDEDMRNVSERYNDEFILMSEKYSVKKERTFPILSKFVKEELVFFDADFSSKDELFQAIGQQLVMKKYVKKEFIKSIRNREIQGGTDLPVGVAIPHGNPKHVLETVIVIIQNKHYFKWQTYPVKTILIVCISQADTKQVRNIFSDIYYMIENKEILNQLIENSNKQLFLNRLGSEQR